MRACCRTLGKQWLRDLVICATRNPWQRQERQASELRRQAEERAARLKAEVEQLAAKQASLEQQRTAWKEEVKLRLQRAKLKKEYTLQVCRHV